MNKKLAAIFRLLAVAMVLGLSAQKVRAQITYYSRASTNWNLATTWSTVGYGGPAAGAFPVAGDFVNIGNTFTVTITGAASACATLTIDNGGALNVNNTINVLAPGTTTVNGTLTIGSVAGTKIFGGTVTVGIGGTWNETVNEPIVFRGGIANSGTFTANNGLHTFNTNSQILSGSLSIPNVTVTSAGVTVTNNGTLAVSGTLTVTGGTVSVLNNGTTTVGTALSGTGTITQGSGATLNIGGSSGITNMNAAAGGNTVNYTGAVQTVHSNAYFNLVLSGSGTKTLQAGTTSIAGNFELSGTASSTAVVGLNIDGSVALLDVGTSFTAGAFTHNVGGLNWTNNGTVSVGSGSTFVFDGAGQTIGGSSSTPFENLSLTGSGTKILATKTDITGTLSVAAGVNVNLGTFSGANTHSSGMLLLGGALQINGLWGGTGSGAPNINTTFFTANTGTLSVTNGNFTYYARNNGDWNSPGTWSTVGHASSTNAGTFPGATNFAVIGGNFTVTVTANAACAALSFDAGTAVTNTLTINSGNTLTVSGPVTIPQTITSGSNIMNVGAGNLVAGSLAFTTGSPGGTGHRMTISTGTATVSGNVTGTGTSSTVNFTGAGVLQVAGTMFTSASGTLTAPSGTVEYNGSAQTIQALPYRNLTLSGSGNKTLAATTTISGNVTVGDNTTLIVGAVTLAVTGTTTVGSGTGGTLSITSATGTKTFTGLVTVNANGTWTNATEAVTFQNGITNNGTFTAGTGIHTFNTNSQTLSGTSPTGLSIGSVTVTGASVVLTNNIATGGGLTVGTALSGTGRITQGNNAILNIGGTSGITNMTATAAGNTVNYTGTLSGQNIVTVTYVNLGFSGAQTKTAVAGLTINGNLRIESGSSFTSGAFTHNVGGNWINNGTFSGTGSTINLNGTTQNLSGSMILSNAFDNLRLSGTGTKTFSASTTMNELAIDNGAIANLSSANTHTSPALVLAGATQAMGTWGSTASAATNQNNTFFSGDGLITVSVGGTTYYSIADADWSAPTTWSTTGFGGGAASQSPGAGDYVIIGNGRTVTVTAPQLCQELLFDAAISAANSLSISTGSLAVAGPITIPQNSGSNTLSVGAGSLTGASLDFTAGTGVHQLTINTGTAIISGNITGIGASSTVQFTGAGELEVGGSMFTSATGTLTSFTTTPGSTVVYNGAAQTIQALTYENLTLSGSGNKTLAATTTIGGDLTIGDNTTLIVGAVTLAVTGTTTIGSGTGGTLSITSATGTKTFTGPVIVNANGTWTNTTEAVTFQNGITNNGTFTAGTGIHTFNTNSQALSGTSPSGLSIGNVTVTGASVVLTNNIATGGGLTVGTALSGTGRITQGNNAILNIGGTSGITNMTATAAGNTVNYTGTLSGQNIVTVTYVNLGFSGAQTKTALAGLTINGNLRIESGSIFTSGAFHHFVAGDWINNGTFNGSASGEITLNGTGPQNISGGTTTFYDLTLAGSGNKVFLAVTAISNAFSINSGAVADLGVFTPPTNHTANTLLLNGMLQSANGTWGSTGSAAVNTNDTYFLNTSAGEINIAQGGNTYYSRANTDWNTPSTWSTVGFGGAASLTAPGAADFVFIGNGNAVTLAAAGTCSALSFDAGTSVTNSLTIGSSGSLTVSGAITIPQTVTGGSNTLAVGAGTLTADDLDFVATLSGAGHIMTISTGTATITNSISGSGVSSTIQFTGAGILRVGGSMFTTLTGTLTAFAGSTVEYNGAAQTVQALPYQNVRLSGSGNKTLEAATTTISGSFVIDTGVTFIINSTTGTKTFIGLVTINNGATWSNTANEAVTFRGGITNNGTFTAGTAVQTFNTNSQALSGTLSIPNITITGVTLTNNNTLTVSTALSGGGEIAQGSGTNAVLNIGFAGPPAITTMTATGSGNTVNYTGAAQTVRPISYVNLGLSGSGVKTLTGVNTIAGTLTLSGTVSATPAANLTIGGALTIGPGTTFSSGAFDHAIGGSFTNNGTFNNNSRRITFSGSASTKIIQGSTPTTFYRVHIAEGAANPDVQIDQTVNLVDEMTFDDDAILDADGPGNNRVLTLISTASGDARIGSLGGTADVTGNVTVQRYMDAEGKIYRYISTPVDNPSAQDLQGEIPITGPFTGSSFPPQTGCTSCAPCTGCVLDQTSMYVYDETIVAGINNRYSPFPGSGGNNSETMTPGRGYAVYLRNDLTPTTWNLRAPLNKGAVNLNPTKTGSNDGFNLVGNPYASPIDWESPSWTKSNIDPTIYIWDNSINNYASYTLGGSFTNGGSRYIAHGQAFWVTAITGAASLSAQEGIKADRASISQATFFRTANPVDNLRIKLMAKSSSDEVLIKLNEKDASADFDAKMDAFEFPSDTLLSIHSITADKKRLAVNVLGAQAQNTTEIKLGLAGVKPGSFSIDFVEFENFSEPTSVYLLDRFANNLVEILPANRTHTFIVTADPASAREDRFVVYLTRKGEKPALKQAENQNFADNIALFPNPAEDKITIRVKSAESVSVGLYNTLGIQIIRTVELVKSGNESSGQLDLTSLEAGVYIVHIQNGANSYNQRILKR